MTRNSSLGMDTLITRLWGIDVPIIGAPMAGRAGGELAAAVSAAGGLGMIGVGANTSPEWITENAEIARGGGNFGIGLMVWALDDAVAATGHADQFEAALAAKPTVLSLAFGDPGPWVKRAHDAGISVVAPVNTRLQVCQALDADVDVLCVQGSDAGGHTGRIGTMALMQNILAYVAIHAPAVPVAVAGGIGSGRGVAAVLGAGADAAWIGTALLGSPEALGSAELKDAAVTASSRHTVLTGIYDRAEQVGWDIDTWPTRTVRNDFVDRYADDRTVTDAELIAARAPGGDHVDDVKLHAGQGIGLLQRKEPAGHVVRRMAQEASTLLRRFC